MTTSVEFREVVASGSRFSICVLWVCFACKAFSSTTTLHKDKLVGANLWTFLGPTSLMIAKDPLNVPYTTSKPISKRSSCHSVLFSLAIAYSCNRMLLQSHSLLPRSLGTYPWADLELDAPCNSVRCVHETRITSSDL
jgi:hypothetical protein